MPQASSVPKSLLSSRERFTIHQRLDGVDGCQGFLEIRLCNPTQTESHERAFAGNSEDKIKLALFQRSARILE